MASLAGLFVSSGCDDASRGPEDAPASGAGAGGAALGGAGGTSGSGGASGSGTGGGSSAGGTSAGSGGNASSGGAPAGGGTSGVSGTSGTSSGGSGAGGAVAGGGGEGGGPPEGGAANAAGGGQGGLGGASGAGAGGASSEAPGVRFVGRVDTTDAAGPRFAWSGTGIVARFSGTSVGVRLEGGQQYSVVIDGMVRPKLVPTSGVTPVASGLAAGEHTIELYRRTEAHLGESQFLGFDFGDGELLAPPPAPARRLEVVGDSITCGYGNEGADMSCPFSPDTENHYLTYAAISARTLEAELSTVCWSGKGVVCNYGDDASSCMDPMPDYYDRTLPQQASSLWDFSRFQPHAVVINLGTNDFSTAQDPTPAQFEDAYVAFLERVREKYPEAWILCTVGPLLSGADLTTARSSIDNAVSRRAQAGDSKVKTFALTPTDPADGYGCDYHPNLTTHQKMAAELTTELEQTLGW
ncbi:MAG TPA: SGNH/GDSL hydrolase family protein [Polyangiaceae bacterium]|nr:SGNH/GDSL hydrolase family protein [Polyangiaceae bacterium]